jgi:hypothetical protein
MIGLVKLEKQFLPKIRGSFDPFRSVKKKSEPSKRLFEVRFFSVISAKNLAFEAL